MKKGMGNKKKSPSRERYEKENPTVSARVPAETRDKLLVNLAKLNMTLSDALKVLAGELEVKVVPIDEARGKGFEDAMKLCMVTYPCHKCGKPMHITSPRAKEAVRGFMIEQGWGHSRCP
jgi:hypothetical protein